MQVFLCDHLVKVVRIQLFFVMDDLYPGASASGVGLYNYGKIALGPGLRNINADLVKYLVRFSF